MTAWQRVAFRLGPALVVGLMGACSFPGGQLNAVRPSAGTPGPLVTPHSTSVSTGGEATLPGADARPTVSLLFDRDALEPYTQQILERINLLRLDEGVPALVSDPLLQHVAFLRSEDMAVRGYFAHEDPADGSLPASILLDQAGFRGLLTEVIFATDSPLGQVAEAALESWADSPNHRAVLLNADLHLFGAGLMGDATWWKVTVVFAEQGP